MRRRAGLQYALGLAVFFAAPVLAHGQTTPLTIDEAVDRFLEQNLEVEAARLNVESARAERVAAALRPNPRLEVTAENFKFAGENAPFDRLYEVAVSYAETIELGGKRRLRRAVADLAVALEEARLEDALRRGVVEVKRLHYEAVLAREELAGATRIRDAFEQLVRSSQARFEGGAAPEADLIKVRLEHTRLDAAVRRAALAYDQAAIRLIERIGESSFDAYAIAGELEFQPMHHDLDRLRTMAMESRPDLRAARLEANVAAERLALERARGVPDITPFVGYKRVASADTVLFGVSIPLGLRDRNQGGIARAAVEERIAETRLGAVQNRALAEVESAYRASRTARAQVLAFEQQLLEPASESRQIALVTYREGAAGLLPLLEAERTEIEIRQEYLRALFEYRASILDLELAVGKDIEP